MSEIQRLHWSVLGNGHRAPCPGNRGEGCLHQWASGLCLEGIPIPFIPRLSEAVPRGDNGPASVWALWGCFGGRVSDAGTPCPQLSHTGLGPPRKPQHMESPLSHILVQEGEMRKPLHYLPPLPSAQHLPRCRVLPGPSMHTKACLRLGQGGRRGWPSERDRAARASCDLSSCRG